MNTRIDGRCDAAFDAVADAFTGNFTERGEVGGAVCVIVDGHVVVDLVGGWADEERTQSLDDPTRWSTSTPSARRSSALLALQLVDDGLIGLDDPIASVWPEFGDAGKAERHGAPRTVPPGRRAGDPRAADERRPVELGAHDRGAGRDRAVVGAGHASRLPHEHLRSPRRRDRPPRHRRACRAPGCATVAEPLDADVWCGVPPEQQRRCADVIWAPATTAGRHRPRCALRARR